jgi:hypothetical protein
LPAEYQASNQSIVTVKPPVQMNLNINMEYHEKRSLFTFDGKGYRQNNRHPNLSPDKIKIGHPDPTRQAGWSHLKFSHLHPFLHIKTLRLLIHSAD